MSGWAKFGVIFAGLCALAALGGAIYLAWFASLPKFSQANFWESLVEGQPIVGFVRLVLMFAAVYVILSIIARISRGQWLNRAGPFQVQDSVQKLTSESQTLQANLRTAEATIQELQVRLATTAAQRDQARKNADEALKTAQEAVDGWRREVGGG